MEIDKMMAYKLLENGISNIILHKIVMKYIEDYPKMIELFEIMANEKF